MDFKNDHVWVRLTPHKLDNEIVADWCTRSNCGAIVLFIGTTRDFFEGQTVTHLEYEAYDDMAMEEMRKICEEALAQYPDCVRASLHHRTGTVNIKESSILCTVSAKHRAQAFEACEWMMKDLKARVPIWKKEFFATDATNKDGHGVGEGVGSGIWKENAEYQP